MASRAWLILLDLDGGGEPSVHATVDGDVLLPGKTYEHALEALEYVDHVLSDFRNGDSITLIALNAPAPFSAWTTRIRSVAIQWCAIVLSHATYSRSAGKGPSKSCDVS